MQKTKSFSLLSGVLSLCLMIVFALGFAACGESTKNEGKYMFTAIQIHKVGLEMWNWSEVPGHENGMYVAVKNKAEQFSVSTKCGDVTYYCCSDYTSKKEKNEDNEQPYDKYNYSGLRLIFDGKKYDTAQLLAAVQIFYFDYERPYNDPKNVSASIHENGYIIINDVEYENADKIYIAVEWFYLNDDNTDMHSVVVL